MSATKWLKKTLPTKTTAEIEEFISHMDQEVAKEKNPMVRSSLKEQKRIAEEYLKRKV